MEHEIHTGKCLLSMAAINLMLSLYICALQALIYSNHTNNFNQFKQFQTTQTVSLSYFLFYLFKKI